MFVVVDTLCEKPVEFLLTLLPSLSYFIASNGVQLFLNNLLAPVIALLDVAEPVAGTLIEDLIGKALGEKLKPYMPEGTGRIVTEEVTAEDGTVTTKEYTAYTIDEITGIAGESGENLVKILNKLLSGLLVKTPEGEEAQIISILPETVFADYPEHAININAATGTDKYYYWYQDGDKLVKIADEDYNYTIHGDIKKSRYVVDHFSVDIADSLVFLLDTVLSDDLLNVLVDLMGLDLTSDTDMLSIIIKHLIDGNMNGLVVSDLLHKLFENYDVTYAKLNGLLIPLDHYDFTKVDVDDAAAKAEKIPTQLDNIIDEAIPVLAPIVKQLMSESRQKAYEEALKTDPNAKLAEPNVLESAFAKVESGDINADLTAVVDSILGELLFNNDTVTKVVRLLPTVYAIDIINIIFMICTYGDYKMDPQGYLAQIDKNYAADDKAVIAMHKIIGNVNTWKEVAANNTDPSETEKLPALDFGVTDYESFKHALSVALHPMFPILQLFTQGKKLTLFSYTGERYVPVNLVEKDGTVVIDDSRDGTELGNGYLEVVGSNSYEQAIMPLLDALGVYEKHGDWDAANKTGLMSQEQFNEIANIEDLLEYLLDIIFNLVHDVAADPFQFLSRNLASLLYYLGNDNLYYLGDTFIGTVNNLLAIVDPLYIEGGIRVPVTMLKLEDTGSQKGLLSTINDMLANANIDFKLTKDMIFKLAGKMGDYKVIDTLRTTADYALINNEGKYVDKDGNLLTEADIAAGGRKITTLVGVDRYFFTGLIDFVCADGLLGKFIDTSTMNAIVADIINNVTGPESVENVIEIALKILNKYLVQYKAIEEPGTALVKQFINYADSVADKKRSVTKAETEKAIANIDAAVAPILKLVGVGTIEDLLNQYLYTDDIVNMLVSLLVGLLGGMDADTWKTVEDVLGYVKDVIGIDIQISPAYYATVSSELAGFIGDCTTWAQVAEKYTKYAYTYDTGKTDAEGKAITATIYLANADLDGQEYDVDPADDVTDNKVLTKAVTTTYKYTYTIPADPDVEGATDETVTVWLDKTGLTEYKVGETTYTLTAVLDGDTQVSESKPVTKVESDYAWGVSDATTTAEKTDKLVKIICDLLKPFNPILELLLCGGVYGSTGSTFGDSIGVFKEINLMGGSGYNYAIIPLFEAFGLEADEIKSQADYEATVTANGPLSYILKTILTTVNNELNTPLSFVLDFIANLAYTVSKNGLTTIVSNLIAPVNELVKAVEGVIPVSINVDLVGLLDGTGVAKLYLGNEVKVHNAEVGIKVNLDSASLEDAVKIAINKFIPALDLEFRTKDIAEMAAKVGADGNIIYTDSVVDPKWDVCLGTPGKNIQGDKADTILAVLDMVVTSENIQALLDLLKVDMSTLDPALVDLINKVIDNPTEVIDAVIKLLSGSYEIAPVLVEFAFRFLGEEKYSYKDELGEWKSTTTKSIGKLDKIINNAIPGVLKLLATGDKPIAFIKDLYDGLGAAAETATIKTIVDYLLETTAFNDDMVNKLLGLIVGGLGGLDETTVNLIQDLVKEIAGIDLTPAGIIAKTTKIQAYLNTFTASDTEKGLTWADIAKACTKYAYTYVTGQDAEGKDITETYYGAKDLTSAEIDGKTVELTPVYKTTTDKDGNTVTTDVQETAVILDNTWGVHDKDTFLAIFYELTGIFAPLLDFLFRGKKFPILGNEDLALKGNRGYENAIIPLAKALGIELTTTNCDNFTDANAMLDEVIDGIFGLVDDIQTAPISTILEVLGSASFFLANNGVEAVISNLISPVTALLEVVSGIVSSEDIDGLLTHFIKISLTDIKTIAGAKGEKLVSLINGLIGDVEIVGPDGIAKMVNLLPEDFFVQLSKYGIKVHDVPKPDVDEITTNWSVDKTDVLMYLLQTVFTDDTLAIICKVAGLDTNEQVASIVKGLAGKQDEVVEIITKLLNEYKVTYNKIAQQNITKIDVTPKDPLTDTNINNALTAIDKLIPTVLGLVMGDGATLETVITDLLKNADLGNLVMNMLVPVLAGLDIDKILDIVKDFTNISLDIAPSAFKSDFGSQLKNFINGKTTWAEVEEAYSQYVYTYTDADGKEVTYYAASATETSVTIGEGENAKTYALTNKYEQKIGEDGKPVFEADGETPVYDTTKPLKTMHSTFDWQLEDFDDITALVCDLLAPLDIVFQVILSGKEIVAIPDTDTTDGTVDQIQISGGYGYNYAIIPLLEAFGVTPITQAEYDAQLATNGSLKYILDEIFGFVSELCNAPIDTLLSRLANLFYFIGSDGINTVVKNLIAPVNELAKEIDDVFPIAITIDLKKVGIAGESVLATYLGKEHPGVAAGVTINVAAADLANLLNSLIREIKIGENVINLALDLDWNKIAAMMAKTANEAEKNTTGAELLKIDSKQDYTYGVIDDADADIPAYKNITGDKVDTFITLLQVILTADNTEGIAKLIKSLIPDSLDPTIAEIVYDVLNDPDSIEKLIGVVVLVLSGEYTVNDSRDFIYKFLGALDFDYAKMDDFDTAIEKFDNMVSRAAPMIVGMLGDPTKPEADQSILDKLAAGVTPDMTLDQFINWALNEFLFKESSFDTIMQALVKILGENVTADLTKTINDLLGIDLSPTNFATATGYNKLIDYVAVTASDAKIGVTWADVLAAHATKDEKGNYTFDEYAWGVTDKDTFVSALLKLLLPLEKLLGFILCGEDLTFNIEGIMLKGGNAFNNALNPLFKALGLEQFGGELRTAATGNDALKYVIEYLFVFVDAIGEAPLTTILTVVGNLSYFIANDNLEPLIRNLTAPILGILELANSVISMDQIDGLISGLTKGAITLTGIIEIGNNSGANLVDMINKLIGGIEIKDENENVIYTLKALPEDFFVEFSKYVIDVTDPTAPNKGDDVNTWTVDVADGLMYILATVLDEDFLKTIFSKVGVNTSEGIGSTLLTLADKEYDLADVIIMLLNDYSISYKRIKQADLGTATAPYYGALNHDNTTNAIKALDPLLVSVLGMLGVGDLKTLIDGLVSGADLGNLLMNLLVPVLAGLDLDAILSYVNELTNLGISSLAPSVFANDKFGSQLKNFINASDVNGDGTITWAEVEETYSQYVYTYTDENGNSVEYFSVNADETTVTIGEGENAKTYELSNKYEQAVDAEGNPVYEADGTTPVYDTTKPLKKMHSTFDWKISTKEDLVNFACELLAPLDVVFQILLCGRQIVALEDKEVLRRADIRINGGYGYNYAVLPLLEAFGADPLTQVQYESRVKTDGSSLKYIFDVLFTEVDEILATPVNELMSRLANIFYFIGSDGINTIAENLLAPINTLIAEVDDVYPIAIRIDLAAEKIVDTYIGVAHDGIPDGISINVSGEALAAFINKAIGNLNINGTEIKLSLDLDWNALAAKMAKKNADGSIITIGTKQAYTYGVCEAGADLKNISGDPADALVTLLDTALTPENSENIKNLVEGLLKDVNLDENIKNIVNDILNDPNAIKNLVASVVLILTGSYDVNVLDYVYKFLGAVDFNNIDGLDDAIVSLDKVLNKAAPVVITMLADTSKPENEWTLLEKIAKGIEGKADADLSDIVDYLLGSMVFTDDMMATITSALVKALGGFLTADLANTLNSLLGVNLAPTAFAAATGNAQLIAYVNVTPADAEAGVTWADVLKAHSHDTGDKNENGEAIIKIDPVFTGVDSKDAFVSTVLDLLKPLESVLAFLLTGKDLTISVDESTSLSLKGGNAYETALVPLIITGLGLKDLGVAKKDAASANQAVENVLDYVFALVDNVCAAPFTTILTVVGNLSFFIANNDVEVAIQNLAAPVLGILDALDDVISRDQIDGLLKGFIGMGLSDIIGIAGNKGEALVTLINDLLSKIEITDSETGEVVYVVKALPTNFFEELAKAAVKIDAPTGELTVGQDVTKWHVENGDTLMYVLDTVLTRDFLNILCTTLKLDTTSTVGEIILSIDGKSEDVAKILIKLLKKYLVEYKVYTQPQLEKIEVTYSSAKSHEQLNDALMNLDSIIPVVLGFIGDGSNSSLKDIVYPLFVKDDIANLLVSSIAKLLSGLPAETIDQVMGYVHELTNLTDLDINPQAFTATKFGSKLADYIGTASTWAEVWEAHSEETTAEDGTVTRTATAYDWGITSTADLVNLVCDMLLPLDGVLALLLMGGTDRATFEKTGVHNGSKITAFEDINVIGGSGYNYAIIPVLELLGINAKTQAEYEAYVAANHGSTLKYILDAVFAKVDEILDKPIANVLPILANLCYVIGNDNLETIVQNLIAPVNNLLEAVDPIFPIAINVNLGNIGTDKSVVETYLGKSHPGVDAGVQITVKGSDLAVLLNNVLSGIMINGKPLGIALEFDWLKLAATAAANNDGDKYIDMTGSSMSTKYDIYNGADYQNVVGDPADTFVTLIKLILTKENYEKLLEVLGKTDGFGEPLDSLIEQIINDPTKLIDIIVDLIGGGDVSYIPVQNRPIKLKKFDYSTYLMLTEANADIIANNLDDLIIKILGKTDFGSLKGLLGRKYINNATINLLLDKLVPLLGGDTVANILNVVKSMSTEETDLDFTVQGYYAKFIDNYDYYTDTSKYQAGNVYLNNGAALLKAAATKEGGTWADVGSFEGTDWGFKDGDIQGFLRVLTDVLTPLNSVLELLLMGEGKALNILDIVSIGGGNGYDYGIIPILEAFGLTAEEVLTYNEYKALCEKDHTQVIGYILTKIGVFAERLLDRPVDVLTTILPNVAYFISNEGVYLSVRNIVAPVFSILELVGNAYNIDFVSMLNVSKLLHNININIQVLGQKYGFKIPEIDFYKLAQEGGTSTKEVATSRSYMANSFTTPTDPFPYINDYGTGKYDGWANKLTQTFVVSDKGDTLTLVLTWALEMFGDKENRAALVDWLADVFMLQSGAKQTVAYGIDKMFDTCSKYDVPDIIVAALFQALGIAIQVDAAFTGDMNKIQKIYQEIFDALGSNDTCIYGSIAQVMEEITGTWNDTIGDHDDYHEAVDEAEQSLNWFQRLLAKIKAFFQKIFSVFK